VTNNLFIMLGSFAGGIGLFLLGMRLMTDGLKYAAGKSLRTILENSTSTPLRGVLSGAFLTSLVQSSGAVTVATIGFVNAGLMDLSHAITLVYGSNIGTTATGWLVSLVGFNINIKAFALPAIGLGMFLWIIKHDSRSGALGDVLAGFGIFFLGIEILKLTFAGLGESIQIAALAGGGMLSVLIFIGIGFLLTCLMQSSSAAIAIILTAVAGNVVPLNDAAAAVIGANIGSTSTAALSVINATPNAKRLAGGHVIFNLVTGFVALLLLPLLLRFLNVVQETLAMSNSPATLLALFHTVFNVLGVIIFFPATKSMVRFLNRRFRTSEEDDAQPRYLDHTLASTPVLAIHALTMELKRIGLIARRMANASVSIESKPGPRLLLDRTAIEKLVAAVAEFGNSLQRSHLPKELDNELPNALRVAGYYNDMAELAVEVANLQPSLQGLEEPPEIVAQTAKFKSNSVKLIKETDIDSGDYSVVLCRERLEGLKEEYRILKAGLLRTGCSGEMTVARMVNTIEQIARIRRIAEQSEKAARYLTNLNLTEDSLRTAHEPGNGTLADDGEQG